MAYSPQSVSEGEDFTAAFVNYVTETLDPDDERAVFLLTTVFRIRRKWRWTEGRFFSTLRDDGRRDRHAGAPFCGGIEAILDMVVHVVGESR